MRTMVLLSAIALALTGTAVAQESVLGVVMTEVPLYVDSVVLFTPQPETITTPDFGGEQVEDTFDFGPRAVFPLNATVFYTVEGRQMDPLVIIELMRDYWYELAGFDYAGQIKFDLGIGAVEENPGTGIGRVLTVAPTPFTASAQLSFELAEPGPVTLAVFDRAGMPVRTLARSVAAAGSGRYCWDGCDERGERLPAGVYFARLSTPDGQAVARLVLAD